MTFKEYYYSEDNEYKQFCYYIDNQNEGLIPSFIKNKIDFVKNLATTLGTNIEQLYKLFKERKVFNFFNTIKWSFEKLFNFLKNGFNYIKEIKKAIFQYLSNTKVAKWTEEQLKDLDKWLQKHPKIKKYGGLAVGAILVYIWFNMTFTGDITYDFNMDDLINAISGDYSLSSLFAGEDGIKLLLLFATGMIGLSFPWPGPSNIQFISGIIYTLAKKVKLKLNLKFK